MNYMQIQRVSNSIVQEKTLFLGFVQKCYCPELLHPCFLVQGLFQGLCRNINFQGNIHLWLRVKEERLNDSESTRYSEKSFLDCQRMRKSDCSRNVQGSTQDSLDKTRGNICLQTGRHGLVNIADTIHICTMLGRSIATIMYWPFVVVN